MNDWKTKVIVKLKEKEENTSRRLNTGDKMKKLQVNGSIGNTNLLSINTKCQFSENHSKNTINDYYKKQKIG